MALAMAQAEQELWNYGEGGAGLNEIAPANCFGNSVLENYIPTLVDKKIWGDGPGTLGWNGEEGDGPGQHCDPQTPLDEGLE